MNHAAPAGLTDRRVDTVLHIDEHVLAPERVGDLAPRDQLTSPPHEQDQDIQGLPFESDPMSVAAQFVRRDVELEVANAKRPAEFRGDTRWGLHDVTTPVSAAGWENRSSTDRLQFRSIDRYGATRQDGSVRCNPCDGKPVIECSRRVCHDVGSFGST